jgi:hypothetical protein
VEGANVNVNEDGTFHSVLDPVAIQYLTGAVSAVEPSKPACKISCPTGTNPRAQRPPSRA